MKHNRMITPEGMKDILLEECTLRRTLREKAASRLRRSGYREVVTPGVEFYDLFDPSHTGFAQEDLYKKTVSNMVEAKTRGAFVMAVTNVDNTEVERAADYVVYIPKTNKYFTNSLAIIPLQLFGYYVSVGKGCDVDKPRNLAKSVTVI